MLNFVTGRLKRALLEWKLIYVAKFIIEVIEFGYKLPFKSNEDMILALAGQFIKQLSHEPEKFR